jgi:hypothetical protein
MKLQLSINGIKKLLFGKYAAGLLVAATGVLLSVAAEDSGLAATVLMRAVPKDVQNIIDNYVSDSAGHWGFYFAKKAYVFDQTIQAKDIKVGVPFEEFRWSDEKLAQTNDSTSLDSLIVPLGIWNLPILARGKYLYILKVSNFRGPWECVQMSKGSANEWQRVRSAWPENSGLDPILINDGIEQLLHFPKKDKYNIVYLYGESDSNGVYKANSISTYNNMKDSRTFLKYYKDKRRKRIAENLRMEELRLKNREKQN